MVRNWILQRGWGKAPAGADMVRGEFEGRVLEGPVNDIAFLLVWWRVPVSEQWPRVLAFRIGGRWSDSE